MSTLTGRRAGHASGFTLVEVLVALLVMAVLAGLAWRGLDGVVRSRDHSRESVDRTQRLATLLTQWEQDLRSLHDDDSTPALAFDGRTLRLVRRSEDGVRLVAWTLEDTRWQRWSSPVLTRQAELQQAWLRSQQLGEGTPGLLTLLEPVRGWQVYYFRGNAWTNAQSTGDVVAPSAEAVSAAAASKEQLPSGVRLVVDLDGQTLTRDIALGPHGQ